MSSLGIAVRREAPDSPDAVTLISELEAELDPLYPSKSQHGYSVEKLVRENVAFFIAYIDGVPAGCGGIQLYAAEYGELKRMFVRTTHRGRGVATRVVEQLAEYARSHGVALLRLETGIYQHEAIKLYERMGFYRISAFGEYRDDPLSRYYEKRI